MSYARPIVTALLLGSGAFTFNASAQDGSPAVRAVAGSHQEIGINLFSWINVNFQDIHGLTPPGGDVRYANGLLYKWHCHRNVLRAGVDVFRDHYAVTSIYQGGHRDGQSTDTRFRLGYERRFSDSRIQPFAGADVGFRYFHDSYDFAGQGDFIYNPTSGTVTAKTQQIFIAPFVGLDYHFADHWSVAIEFTSNFFFGHRTEQRDEHSYTAPNGSSSSSTRSDTGSTLDPVRSFCLVYHF